MCKFNKLDLNTFHWAESAGAELAGKYDMPVLQAVHEVVPDKMVPFHNAISQKEPEKLWYHFYEDDYQFERIWNNTDKYIPILRRFKGGITPDFSVYLDMPRSQQIWNCWRNRVLAYYMQKQGLLVVPNVSWSDVESLEWAFDGIPEGSVLSVTSQGCMGHDYICKQSFLNGLHELVRKKHPELIIVYGKFPEAWKERFSIPIVTCKSFSEERWGK
jgi:hypothetical protein